MGTPKKDDLKQPNSLSSTPGKSKRQTRSRVACDWCHSNHARCDQTLPCSRCIHKGTQCEFTRVRRKRGRISRRNYLGASRLEETSISSDANASPPDVQSIVSPKVSSVQTPEASLQGPYSAHDLTVFNPEVGDLSSFESEPWLSQGLQAKVNTTEYSLLSQGVPLQHNNFPIRACLNDRSPPSAALDSSFANYGEFALPGPGCGAVTTPHDIIPTLRYPVLLPLMPFIKTKLSPELACDLLNHYFTSAFATHIRPVCQHIHCFVLRKASFLNERNYRPSTPALLASMLWVASSDDHAPSPSITTDYRKKICQFLGSLAIKLLNPPIHSSPDKRGDTTISEALFSADGLGSLPKITPCPSTASDGTQSFEFPAASVDDVITYVHIASIVSTSEQKAHSMTWWYAAFTLALEQKLNREIEPTPSVDNQDVCFSYMDPSFHSSVSTRKALDCVCYRSRDSTTQVTEEQREERRRVWWLLYIMDRHLALCYNRPMMLLDSESKDLLLPLDEEAWQAGKIHSNSPNSTGPKCVLSGLENMRRMFPDSKCHDPSIFGFFLPLMTIMGQMIDLHQIKDHPMLRSEVLRKEIWETQLHEVLHRLDLYEVSLTTFITNALSTPNHDTTERAKTQAYFWLSQTITSYASYYIDVLHILQNGYWDPVSHMENGNAWNSSPNFISAIPHALKAAGSIRQILKFDPDVSFMPEFFSIQLLQGGFYFLLILERLQGKAEEPFLSACEAIIQATESCIVTLDTGYLRNFCQVMRSTVAQARGRPANHYEIQQRRRAILALHKWTGAGTAPG